LYTVGPLNIAYRDGESAMVYVKFPTLEDGKSDQQRVELRRHFFIPILTRMD
jgi:hypothetical protein